MALLLTSVFGVTGCGSDDGEAPAESRIKNSTMMTDDLKPLNFYDDDDMYDDDSLYRDDPIEVPIDNIGLSEQVDDDDMYDDDSKDDDFLDSNDLLPEDSDSTWIQNSPSGSGGLDTGNLLNAGHHVGINTTGCNMRNSNRGLRSEPPNPQVQVSPWLQSTICPDPFRRPLE
jgi:hypothetical protein